jgi:hypothetical protein
LEAAVRAAIESVRLIEGDAREFLPIEADVCITDPPYAVDKRGNMLGQLAANYHDKGTHTRGYADHDKVQFGALMVPVFAGVRDSLPPGATMVAFCGNRTFHQMATFAEEAGFQMLDVLVFPKRKTFARSTSTLVPCHEIAMFMRKPGGTRLINPARNIGNVFDLVRPGKGGVGASDDEGAELDGGDCGSVHGTGGTYFGSVCRVGVDVGCGEEAGPSRDGDRVGAGVCGDCPGGGSRDEP